MRHRALKLLVIQQNLGHRDHKVTQAYIGNLDSSARRPPALFKFELPETAGGARSMSQPVEVFQVGDRVVYVSFRRRIYGVITEIKTENRRQGNTLISVTLYPIRTDDGGSATKPIRYIERVT